MASAFCSNDDVIERKIECSPNVSQTIDFENSYEIKKCTEWIKENGFQRVSTKVLLKKNVLFVFF